MTTKRQTRDAQREAIFSWLQIIGPATGEDLAAALNISSGDFAEIITEMRQEGCVDLHHSEARSLDVLRPPCDGTPLIYEWADVLLWAVRLGGKCARVDTTPPPMPRNATPAERAARVFNVLLNGPATVDELMAATGLGFNGVRRALLDLADEVRPVPRANQWSGGIPQWEIDTPHSVFHRSA